MTNFTGTLPTSFLTGQPLPAAELQTMLDALTALTDAWTDWSSSFVIGASTTAPTMGSSVKTAR